MGRDSDKPMSIGKMFVFLGVIYLLIGGSATWQLRRTCLIERDDCGIAGLLEWIPTSPFSLAGAIVMLLVLVSITWQTIKLKREGKLGVPQEEPEPRFNANGLLVSLVVCALYLGGAMVMLSMAGSGLEEFDPDRIMWFSFKTYGAMFGASLVFMILFHLNEEFTKPAPVLVLLLLFGLTAGAIYLYYKSAMGIG